jgi:hypothetical protein
MAASGACLFFATLAMALPNGGQNEAKIMKKPAMSLRDVQRILQEQDRDLHAAYRTLREETASQAIAPSAQAIERLREVCSARCVRATATEPSNGIRC